MYKYSKFKNLKVPSVFNGVLVPSIICIKCGCNNDKIIGKEESIDILINDINV